MSADTHGSKAKGTPGPSLPIWHDMRKAIPMAAGFAALLALVAMQGLIGSKLPTSPWGYTPLAVQRCLEAATYLCVALCCTRFRSLASHRRVMWGCAIALVLEAAVEAAAILGPLAGLGLAGHAVYSAVGAVAPSVLWLAWIEQYARLDLRRIVLLYLSASVLQALLTLLMSTCVPFAASLVLVAALPLASTGLLGKTQDALDAAEGGEAAPEKASGKGCAEPAASNGRAAGSFPLAPVLLMATFSLANVFARDVLPAEDRTWATVGVLACLVALAFALRTADMRFDLWPLCAVAFPLSLAGLFGLLLPSETWGVPATLCTHAADALFGAFMAVTLCNVSYRYATSALYLFGLAKAAGSIASLAGAMLAFGGSPWGRDDLVLLVAGVSLALTVCYVALSWKRPGEITWGASAKAAADAGASPQDAELRHARDLRETCTQAAYEYGLTRREEEVLLLLVSGKSAQQIEEALCVSNSTVKSHTHAVYQKVGVHSRTELAERVAP